jgi:hypothetical protein
MRLFSYILSQSVHCWCVERLLIFVSCFYILLLLLKLFMVFRSFWWSFSGLLGIRSCHLQIV